MSSVGTQFIANALYIPTVKMDSPDEVSLWQEFLSQQVRHFQPRFFSFSPKHIHPHSADPSSANFSLSFSHESFEKSFYLSLAMERTEVSVWIIQTEIPPQSPPHHI